MASPGQRAFPQAADALEAAYVVRAREALGARLDDVSRIVLDRREPADGADGLALAGWWAPPHAGPPLLVMPNPWDDRDALAMAEEHSWATTNSVVEYLAPLLDDAVGEARGVGAWHLILAPWVLHTVSALADRRLFCVAAASVAPGRPFETHPTGEAPPTQLAGLHELRTDDGTREIGSAIVAALGLLSRSVGGAAPASRDLVTTSGSLGGALRLALRNPVHHVTRIVGQSLLNVRAGRRVALVGQCNLTARDALRLIRRTPRARLAFPPLVGLRPLAFPPTDHDRRQALVTHHGEIDPLTELALTLMPRLLPRSVL